MYVCVNVVVCVRVRACMRTCVYVCICVHIKLVNTQPAWFMLITSTSYYSKHSDTLNASIYIVIKTIYFHTKTELEYGISISMERFNLTCM